VVVIAVVNRQFAHIGEGELAGATAANPRVDLERALPIAGFPGFARFARIENDAVEALVVYLPYSHATSLPGCSRFLAHYRKRCETVRREREIGGRQPLRLTLNDIGKAVADHFPGNRVQATGIAPSAKFFGSSGGLPDGGRLMCGSSDLI
jgi:hypothetical protein